MASFLNQVSAPNANILAGISNPADIAQKQLERMETAAKWREALGQDNLKNMQTAAEAERGRDFTAGESAKSRAFQQGLLDQARKLENDKLLGQYQASQAQHNVEVPGEVPADQAAGLVDARQSMLNDIKNQELKIELLKKDISPRDLQRDQIRKYAELRKEEAALKPLQTGLTEYDKLLPTIVKDIQESTKTTRAPSMGELVGQMDTAIQTAINNKENPNIIAGMINKRNSLSDSLIKASTDAATRKNVNAADIEKTLTLQALGLEPAGGNQPTTPPAYNGITNKRYEEAKIEYDQLEPRWEAALGFGLSDAEENKRDRAKKDIESYEKGLLNQALKFDKLKLLSK